MNIREFIFSDKLKLRLARHSVFWLLFSFYMIFFTYDKYDFNAFVDARTYPVRFENLFLFIPPPLLMVYISIALLPQKNYSKNVSKFIQLGIAIISLICLSAIYIYVLTKTIVIHDTVENTYNNLPVTTKFSTYLSYAIIYPLMAATVAVSIKLIKNWYLKTLEAEKLIQQKKQTELSLLKSRIHPKILLYSLENIHKKLLANSRQSPTMILHLSDLLDYILYQEKEQPVPLFKEIEIVKKYMLLADRSKIFLHAIHLSVSSSSKDFLITPLTLLHLIEFLFELYQLNQNKITVMNIIIEAQNNLLNLKLQVKDCMANDSLNSFIDKEIEVIKNRIQIFYPKRCYFNYEFIENIFSFNLKLQTETSLLENMMSA